MVELEEVGEVLKEGRYWTAGFCRTFLDGWDDAAFEDPRLGRRLAEIGCQLVAKVEEVTSTEQPTLRARAKAILGSSFRASGRLEESERAYAESLALYAELEEPLDQADLYRRMAYLRYEQQRYEEALTLAEQAALVFLAAGDRNRYGWALIAEGTVHFAAGDYPRAVLCFAKALANLEPARSPAYFYAAQHNFVTALERQSEPTEAELERALEALRWPGLRRRSVPAATRNHLEARVLLRAGKSRGRARRLLLGARRDFETMGMPLDVAAVSLDLAQVYLEEGRWPELRQVAAETLKLLEPVAAGRDALAAFRLWQTAIVAGELEGRLVERCRQALVSLRTRAAGSRLVDEEALRRKLRRLITSALEGCSSLEELVRRLEGQGVTVRHRPPRGGRPGGLGFELEGWRIHGRGLGKGYSLPGLLARLGS